MSPRFAPYWFDRFPARRRPSYPRLRTTIDTRVVIIGGGLTGAACAWSLAAFRIPVVLLDADRIGGGATAGSTGLVREDFDVPFTATAAAHGLRTARGLWEGLRRASREFPAALRRVGVKCDLTPQDLLNVVRGDRDAARTIRRDYEARRAAGLDHRWATGANLRRGAAVESTGGIRTRGAVVDPYRACLGLTVAAAARGGEIFERSPVLHVRTRPKTVDVVTASGTVRAQTVVVAASTEIPELRPLRRHLDSRHAYGVVTESLPAAVRRELGSRTTALRDAAAPPKFVRWLKGDRVLVAGADQAPASSRSQDQVLVQRTGQLMYELSLLYPAISGAQPEWAWMCPFDDTADGLPFIGAHRNFPRHLFAYGLGRHGAAAAWLAARLLLRHVTSTPAKGDDVFGFARIL